MSDTNTNNEIEILRDVKNKLLAEKRAIKEERDSLKAKIAEMEASQQSMVAELQAANAKITDFQLNMPVSLFLEEAAVDPKTFRHVFGEKYNFALIDGEVFVTDLEGKPVEIGQGKDKRKIGLDNPLEFAEWLAPKGATDEFARRVAPLLIGSRANGGGAAAAMRGTGGKAPAVNPGPARGVSAPSPFGGLR